MFSLGLRTVEPDGRLVGHLDGEDVWILEQSVVGWHEAAEESVVVDWLAGLGEAGLRKGVVGWSEMDFNDVADFGDDVVGIEDLLAGQTGSHEVRHSGERHGFGDGRAGGGRGVGGSGVGEAEEGEGRDGSKSEHLERLLLIRDLLRN
jgi:hypothetical protein